MLSCGGGKHMPPKYCQCLRYFGKLNPGLILGLPTLWQTLSSLGHQSKFQFTFTVHISNTHIPVYTMTYMLVIYWRTSQFFNHSISNCDCFSLTRQPAQKAFILPYKCAFLNSFLHIAYEIVSTKIQISDELKP